MNAIQAPQRDSKGKLLVGHTGMGGRPPGSRNLLGEKFLADLYKDWCGHGVEVLRTVRDEDPVAYAKIVALLVAKGDNDGLQNAGVTIVNVITGVRG